MDVSRTAPAAAGVQGGAVRGGAEECARRLGRAQRAVRPEVRRRQLRRLYYVDVVNLQGAGKACSISSCS